MEQAAFFSSFKIFLWIERSTSVGRDSVLDPSPICKAIWDAIDRHPGLMQHILQWNANTLRSMSQKLSAELHERVLSALAGPASSDTAAIPGENAMLAPEHYAAVGALVDETAARLAELVPHADLERAEKRVAVMRSIAQCNGRQVCHADTLVVACLLDVSTRPAWPRSPHFDRLWRFD